MQPTQAESLRVCWRPGCSSCAKVKEFLAGLGLACESIGVAADPPLTASDTAGLPMPEGLWE